MKKLLTIIFLFILKINGADVVSVLYFENTTDNEDYMWLSKGLADMLITDLTNVNEIEVVERESLQKIRS